MDSIIVTPKSSTLAASSGKISKAKTPTGTSVLPQVAYGCEHLQDLLKENRKLAASQYELLQRTIHERPDIVSQTNRANSNADGRAVTLLTSTYLCLQCPQVHSPELRDRHFQAKSHAFSVESRSGYLYCQSCQDFVYDPLFEEIRTQKGRRKRKLDDLTDADLDKRLIAHHSAFVPCKSIGLRGLYNMGQTCFMSVILQTLIHNPFIKSFYLAEGHKSSDCEKESCTSCALDEIFAEFHSVEKTEGYGAVAMLLASWMAAQALAGYQQQDAHEYMQFILNNLHAENGLSSNSPDSQDSSDCNCIIHKTFYGKLQSTVTCDNCRNVTTALDPVMDLSLDLRISKKRKLSNDGKVEEFDMNLQDCLERFTGKERLAAADYTCRKCDGQQNATKQLSIKRLPPFLSVHLKRFEHAKAQSSKLDTKIRFPLTLDIYPYTTHSKTSKQPSLSIKPPSLLYELSSVVVHKGKIDSGHYVSYSRKGNDWFLFDDSKVVLVSESDVLDAEAYLLFYMVKSLDGERRLDESLSRKNSSNGTK